METTKDKCLYELERMNDILNDYNVSDKDKNVLNDIIKGAFYELSDAYASSRVLERIMDENSVEYDLKRYIELKMEEIEKFPFDIDYSTEI